MRTDRRGDRHLLRQLYAHTAQPRGNGDAARCRCASLVASLPRARPLRHPSARGCRYCSCCTRAHKQPLASEGGLHLCSGLCGDLLPLSTPLPPCLVRASFAPERSKPSHARSSDVASVHHSLSAANFITSHSPGYALPLLEITNSRCTSSFAQGSSFVTQARSLVSVAPAPVSCVNCKQPQRQSGGCGGCTCTASVRREPAWTALCARVMCLRKTQSRGTGHKGGENTQERQLRLHCDSLSSPDYTAGHEGTNQLPLVLIAVSRPRQRAVLI